MVAEIDSYVAKKIHSKICTFDFCYSFFEMYSYFDLNIVVNTHVRVRPTVTTKPPIYNRTIITTVHIFEIDFFSILTTYQLTVLF